jgi:putative acetyltransferase
MYQLQRTSSENPYFQQLVVQLDKDLAIRDGEEHAFFAQFNKITHIQHVVLVYENTLAVACGAVKAYAPNILEIKRMYVPPTHRGRGIASLVLEELERWAKELGAKKCILETGIRQPEAIRLYQKNDYQSIPNYGQYEGVASSVCFEKIL